MIHANTPLSSHLLSPPPLLLPPPPLPLPCPSLPPLPPSLPPSLHDSCTHYHDKHNHFVPALCPSPRTTGKLENFRRRTRYGEKFRSSSRSKRGRSSSSRSSGRRDHHDPGSRGRSEDHGAGDSHSPREREMDHLVKGATAAVHSVSISTTAEVSARLAKKDSRSPGGRSSPARSPARRLVDADVSITSCRTMVSEDTGNFLPHEMNLGGPTTGARAGIAFGESVPSRAKGGPGVVPPHRRSLQQNRSPVVAPDTRPFQTTIDSSPVDDYRSIDEDVLRGTANGSLHNAVSGLGCSPASSPLHGKLKPIGGFKPSQQKKGGSRLSPKVAPPSSNNGGVGGGGAQQQQELYSAAVPIPPKHELLPPSTSPKRELLPPSTSQQTPAPKRELLPYRSSSRGFGTGEEYDMDMTVLGGFPPNLPLPPVQLHPFVQQHPIPSTPHIQLRPGRSGSEARLELPVTPDLLSGTMLKLSPYSRPPPHFPSSPTSRKARKYFPTSETRRLLRSASASGGGIGTTRAAARHAREWAMAPGGGGRGGLGAGQVRVGRADPVRDPMSVWSSGRVLLRYEH